MISDLQAYYSTDLGAAFLGDSLKLLDAVEESSVDLICTSPPFALLRKKAYGNVHATEYIDWFMEFARKNSAKYNPSFCNM